MASYSDSEDDLPLAVLKERLIARRKSNIRDESSPLNLQIFEHEPSSSAGSQSPPLRPAVDLSDCNFSMDDYPSFFKVLDRSREIYKKESRNLAQFQAEDVVWVKYKTVHWPSLVTRIDKKKKKVVVVFLPVEVPITKSTKRFPTPPENVKAFLSNYEQYANSVVTDGEYSDFDAAVNQAKRILTQQTDVLNGGLVGTPNVVKRPTDDVDDEAFICKEINVSKRKPKRSAAEIEKLRERRSRYEAIVDFIETDEAEKLVRDLLSGKLENRRTNLYDQKIKRNYYGPAMPKEAVMIDEDLMGKSFQLLYALQRGIDPDRHMNFVHEVLMPEVAKLYYMRNGMSDDEAEVALKCKSDYLQDELNSFF